MAQGVRIVEVTFARWRKDGFDAKFVASEVAKGTSPSPAGGLTYSGEVIFGDSLILLETGVEFRVPISDVDRSRIINDALKAALKSKHYGPSVLIGEINKATRDFVRSPETKYVVSTSLSFVHFQDLSRIEGSDCRLYVRRRLPKYLHKAREEAKRRSERTFSGGYPEDAPFFERYALAWIHVRGRSPQEAMDRAVEAMDLRRGIWNFALNRRVGGTYPPPSRGPLNEVAAGPLYSMHRPDGTLAVEYNWTDPEYSGPRLSRNVRRKWDQVLRDEKGIRAGLKRSPYRATLEDALRRYCRALDSIDLSRAFLDLWGLLESLTGISPQDSHNKVVDRASFIWSDAQRKTHEQVLHHLRRHRNSYVHAGEGATRANAYVHQMRRYAEEMLLFHIRHSCHFSSMDRVVRFFDLPFETAELQQLIETQESKAKEALETARLATEGLRFRQSG